MVYKFTQSFFAEWPYEDIINISLPNWWLIFHFIKYLSLQVSHECVGVRWSHACPHSHPIDLEIVFSFESKLVFSED